MPSAAATDNLKRMEDGDRAALRKREHKSLLKSLTMAQISTASMGKFDKKASKKEPDAPKSQKVLKKRSSAHLADLSQDRSKERDRNMKIFNMLEKKSDIAHGGKVNAKIDGDKILKKASHKDASRRKKTK
jgi:hypothetical protein